MLPLTKWAKRLPACPASHQWYLQVIDHLDQETCDLKDWLQTAWRRLADPSLTAFDRRELRNCMKEAEQTLRSAFARVSAQEIVPQQTTIAKRRLNFRIVRLDV